MHINFEFAIFFGRAERWRSQCALRRGRRQSQMKKMTYIEMIVVNIIIRNIERLLRAYDVSIFHSLILFLVR